MSEYDKHLDKSSILWVDDDPYILSSAKRLLSLHDFNLITTENPLETLSLIEKHNISVLICDQRMPQMTGIEVLKEVRAKYPHVTRLMVTGFFDKVLLEEAVNEGGVFRFINKPWSEQELISDIKQGLEHTYQIQKYNKLSREIRNQNKVLTQFTENLEGIIFDRTKEINQFNKDQESKNKQIKDLVLFIQKTHEVNTISELMDTLVKDLSKYRVNPIFCYKSANGKPRILYSSKGEWVNKSMNTLWTKRLDIKVNDKNDQTFLADILKRPVGNVLALPLLKFKNTENLQNTIFIEHSTSEENLRGFMEYLTSRLQVLSLAADRILYIEKIEHDSVQWERTFDSIQNPLSIVDKNGIGVRTNSYFQKHIKNLKDEVELISKIGINDHSETSVLKKGDRTYEVSGFPIKETQYDEVNHFVLYYKNITEERNLYEKMIQNEKMAAIGLLAGNIAHELNNPLTGIRSLAQILKTENLKPEYLSDLEEIDRAALRCQSIIQGLQEFSSGGTNVTHFKRISLNEMIKKTLPFLKSAVRHHNFQVELHEEDVEVFADPQILQQVIFNLIINACQALNAPGTISVKSYKSEDFGLLEIKDSGPGIPPDVASRIFEPFFTTKKEGEGTGLGLSFCKSALEKMGGEIDFITSSDKGTIFTVRVPRKSVSLKVVRLENKVGSKK